MSHPENLQLEYLEGSNQRPTRMSVWQADRLLTFRSFDPEVTTLTQRERQASMALVHADALPAFSDLEFSQKEAFFRIIHKELSSDYNCPPGFSFVDVDLEIETPMVVEMIRACYSNIRVDHDIISSWKAHPAHDPTLWVWVFDDARNVPAGLGIAEIDLHVREASLEWIQVHPFYRGKGLGKAIITELLRRVAGKVDFTTVSGRVDNDTHPEQVYRQCGFTGSDVWWLLIH